MKLPRRSFLAATLPLAVPGLAACTASDDQPEPGAGDGLPDYEYTGTPGPDTLFTHGVASGDPLPEGLILWTRVSPADGLPVDVWYEVATDTAFKHRVVATTGTTDESRDFTFKVDVSGLRPGTTYYYRFFALGRRSPVGRARTAPTGSVARLRFGVVSCSNHAYGWFHAYHHLAQRHDLDAVLHLGDYIYEYGDGEYGSARPCEPSHEILSLDDYRTRYSQYRRDADLQELHRQHTFIAVWDDHETADNSWRDGAENHDPATEGAYADRRTAAARAYREWMPLRESASGEIYRNLVFGDLVELFMLDTRITGRDEPLPGLAVSYADTIASERQLLGATQEAWLGAGLRASAARWKVLGQQVMMMHLEIGGQPAAQGGGTMINPDQWNGYPQARARLLELVRDQRLTDVVVLTGDIHSSWAGEVSLDPWDPALYDPATGEGSLAVEFVTPAITSPGPGGLLGNLTGNPHVKYKEGESRGYVLLDLDATRVQAEWYYVDSIADAALSPERFAKALAAPSGKSVLSEVAEPSAPGRAAAPAP